MIVWSAPAPTSERLFVIVSCSAKVPAATCTVSQVQAALMPRWMLPLACVT